MFPDRVTNRIERTKKHGACVLRILNGKQAGTEVSIPQIGVIIGAGPAAGLILDDPAVSGKHATVIPSGAGAEVTDLTSKNGTWLDGVAITKVLIPLGSKIRIGATEIQVAPAVQYAEVPPSTRSSFSELVGGSLAMRTVYSLLERASQSDAPVLLLGESGTGKELAARAIHDQGPRKNKPFVVFDCGAASASLLESGLFGHKKGSFTGALSDQLGAFARAHGGTLFLDEIGELPIAMQPKLLRMLERGEVTPLGGQREERYDVRFVAATHRDLWAEVAKGSFREDLYYRLAVVDLEIPALRHRIEDIADLTHHFLARHNRANDVVEGPALDRLRSYAWPGNVRELRNVITKAVALGSPNVPFRDLPIVLRGGAADDAPLQVTADVPFLEAKERVIADFELAYMRDLLSRAKDNLSEAARIAGVERKHLYKILERVGLKRSNDPES